jgi:hypothetical protein
MGIPEEYTAYGVVLRQHYEGTEEWLEIVSALPRALFSAELIREVRTGRRSLDISLDKPEIGGILRIKGRDRTLVYRLVEHNFELDYFVGEWPD